jgi:uncharacterized repeat protein (TIGR03803 family)
MRRPLSKGIGGNNLIKPKIASMKKGFGHLFAALALTASPGLLPAQTFTTLHSFSALINGTNNDGAFPYARLVPSGNTLYGTTYNGGCGSNGTVFAVNTDGTGFTNLHTFTVLSSLLRTNTDGGLCIGGVILSGNTLYGTTACGGAAGRGTIFAVNTDGSAFTNLHSFNGNNDGEATAAGLVLSGNTLYGATQAGGSGGYGMLFAMITNGSGYTNLHSFNGNSDGSQPLAGMILSSNILYGTCESGGVWGKGSVFRINTDGTGFTNLHSFTALLSSTNGDGAQPYGGLTLCGNALFGTVTYGGTSGNGALFKVNTDGSGFTNFHSFTALNNSTNRDGANPFGSLFLSGNTLHGTATAGGSSSNGTVFVVNTDGTGFTVLYNSSVVINNTNSDGGRPASGILSSNILYGVGHVGGSGGSGTVFSLFIPPLLTIASSGANAILIWPTNADGFTLQSTPALTSTAVWSNVTPAPVVINAQNAVTNPMSCGQMFYRLAR